MDIKGSKPGKSNTEVREGPVPNREGEFGSCCPPSSGEGSVRQTRLALTVKRGEELHFPEAGVTVSFSERRSASGEFRVIIKAPSNVNVKRRKSAFDY